MLLPSLQLNNWYIAMSCSSYINITILLMFSAIV